MGRTNRTYRQHLEKFFKRLETFKRELRGKNKEYFQKIEEEAYKTAHAGAALNSTNPSLPAFLSILVGQQRRIEELENRLEQLESDH